MDHTQAVDQRLSWQTKAGMGYVCSLAVLMVGIHHTVARSLLFRETTKHEGPFVTTLIICGYQQHKQPLACIDTLCAGKQLELKICDAMDLLHLPCVCQVHVPSRSRTLLSTLDFWGIREPVVGPLPRRYVVVLTQWTNWNGTSERSIFFFFLVVCRLFPGYSGFGVSLG